MAGMVEFFRVAAKYYDADYEAMRYTADVPFYVDLARENGGPVLEMGCGTGRVLLPTARAGLRVHGIEISPDMLAVCRNKLTAEADEVRDRVALTQGDIRTLLVPGEFRLVTAPFRVLQSFTERADQRAWLRNVRRHLAPGGWLVFDVFQPDFSLLAAERGPFVDVERVDPATGETIRRAGHVTPHNALQTMEYFCRWERDGRPEAERAVTLRWFTRGELENLLELEQFRVLDYWGSFAREPFGEASRDQVVRAVAM